MVVLRLAMLGAGTHRDPVLSILSGDDHPEVQLICARPITSSLEPGVRLPSRPRPAAPIRRCSMFRLPHEASESGAIQGITSDSRDSSSFRKGSDMLR